MKSRRQMRVAAGVSSVLAALSLAAVASTVQAQTKSTVSSRESATATVAVKSIDRATRNLVVTNEAGESFSMKAPPEARNFDRLKPGDKVVVTYVAETEYVLSAPNTPLPADAASVIQARTAKGDLPGGAVAAKVVVTGAIVAIDAAHNRLKLISPQGGEVHTVDVKTAEGRRAMAGMKVGDTITAYLTESMLLSVEPR